MNNPVFSIIIPVFNGQKYIPRCLNSILEQTFKNYEIIIVDDGSTDCTSIICQEFLENNPGIRYIKKENGGVSSARNVGIKEARGKYLLFVDADDYVESNYLSSFYECSLKFDKHTLIVCGIAGNCNYLQRKSLPPKMTVGDCIVAIADDTIGGFAVNKLFNRNLIVENKLFFDEKVCRCEDLLFCMSYIPYVKDCYVIAEPLYNYIVNPASATKNDNLKLTDAINVLDRIIETPMVMKNNAAKHYFISNQHHMCIRYLKAALDAKCFDEKASELKITNSLLDFSNIVFNSDIKAKYRLFYLYLYFICKIKRVNI